MDNINKLREKIVKTIYNAQAGHLNSSFSCLEIIFSSLNSLSKNFKFENFVLSKGHAAVAYYVVLNHFEVLNDQELNNFCKDGSVLYGHPIRDLKNKISFTTGSLGNGIAAASGFAYGKKIKKNNQEKIICLVGDGECNEGIFWETLLLINKFDLNNLIIIIDDNLSSNEGSKLPDLEKIIFAFNNIDYQCVNGHDFNQITEVLEKKYSHCQIIHAKTNYGHGSYITINNKVFHHPKLSQHDLNKIINSLKE